MHKESDDYAKCTIGLDMRDIYERKFIYTYMMYFIVSVSITV